MAEKKYAKCVVEMPDPLMRRPLFEGKVANFSELGTENYPESRLWFHSVIVYAPGAGMGCGDDWERTRPDGTVDKIKASRHRHPHDETFLFLGTDPHNPWDLGGEVEVWLGLGEDEEMYRFTKSTMVYVPANTWHNPVWYRKVERPFIEVVVALSDSYYTEDGGTDRYLEKSQDYPPSFVKEYGSILKQFGGPGE
jgi:mannose-6-phosphate isomerase-like protein (cupin superfamily)